MELKAELEKYKNASVEPIETPLQKKAPLANSPKKVNRKHEDKNPKKNIVRQPTIKYKKVLKEDITNIVSFLRLKLISNYTSLKDIQVILNEQSVNGDLSIK